MISIQALFIFICSSLQLVRCYVHRQVCSMKTVAVFGGTGILGRECVYQALKQGHNVVTLARDPAKMLIPEGSGGDDKDKPLIDERLKVIKGDVTDQTAVNAVFESADDFEGVIVALGGRVKDVGPTMLTDGTRRIINAMNLKNIKRIAVVTSAGSNDSEGQAPFLFRVLIYTVLKSVFKDKNNQENLFLQPTGPGHDLEYTIVRPGGLGKGPPKGKVDIMLGEVGSIERADVATFCLSAVFQPNFPYIRKAPCISTLPPLL